MEIKCVKSATRLLDRIWVNKGGLDLSKEVLWVSVGQRAAVLQAVKVGGQKKILPISPARAIRVRTGAIGRIFFWPPTLTACSSAALWPPISVQESSSTLYVSYLHSKWPHFNRTYVIGVCILFATAVILSRLIFEKNSTTVFTLMVNMTKDVLGANYSVQWPFWNSRLHYHDLTLHLKNNKS